MVAVTTVGSGPDRIVLNVSEDAYLGDAMFTVAVDGQQIGSVQTAVVSHALREQQSFYIDGSFGAGSHTLTVDFLNDLYAGTPGTDRNFYVDGVQSGSRTVASGLAFYSAGKQSVAVQVPPQPVTIGTGNDTISLYISEDAYQGDAQFTISIDGVQIGGTQIAQALHSAGQTQAFNVLGDFGIGPHTATVNFLNDAYGGTQDTDRNLYVDRIVRGTDYNYTVAALDSAGPRDFDLRAIQPPTGPVTIGSGPDSLVLDISGDAYSKDGQYYALFTVSVDGVQIGGVQSATASHRSGPSQAFTVKGSFAPGRHTVTLDFLNDASGGTPATDRNLYLDSVTNGGLVTQTRAAILSQGPFSVDVPAPALVVTGSDITGPASGYAVLNGTAGDDTIVAHGAGNTINGQGGSDTITGSEGGGDTITVGSSRDRLKNLNETVTIAGLNNSVVAGDEAVTLSGSASGTIATLGDGNNTIKFDGVGNHVTTGAGANTLVLTGGGAQVLLTDAFAPSNYSDDITFTGIGNSVKVSLFQSKYPASGKVTINGGSGNGNFALGWGSGVVHTDGPGNIVSFGAGTFDISPGSGQDTVIASGLPATPVGIIHLAGTGNTVQGSGATLRLHPETSARTDGVFGCMV